MKLLTDKDRFDELQMYLISEIISDIRRKLIQAGISGDQLYDLTGKMSFSIAAILDGSRVMSMDGNPVLPVLTFETSRNSGTLTCAEEGGSWMHEYVFGCVDEVFESEDEA